MSDTTAELPELAAGNGAPIQPPEPQPDEALSLLAEVKADHVSKRAARTEVFVVPGYEDRKTPLAVRYGVIPFEQQRRLELRFMRDAEKPGSEQDDMRELNHFIAQLIAACREIGVMIDGEFTPLSETKPVRWGDPRLLDGLGLAVSEQRARAVLWAVFEDANGDEWTPYAISNHHTDVIIGWMRGGGRGQGAADEADQEFAKNS